MPATQQPAPPRPTRGAVERLYVYWLTGTLLLILIAVVLALFTRSAIQQSQAALVEAAALTERLEALDQQLQTLQEQLAATPRPVPWEPEPEPTADEPALQPDDAAQPFQSASAVPEEALADTTSADSDAALRAQLDGLLADDPVSVYVVTDEATARDVTQSEFGRISRAEWQGATWARLAVLSRMLGRDAAAEAFARRAAAAGEQLLLFTEISARTLLARARTEEAFIYARQLAERSAAAPVAALLMAEALLDGGRVGSAADALRTIESLGDLHIADKLRLARLAVRLEHWRTLDDVLATIEDVPEELSAEHNFLYAVSRAFGDGTVEALAVLDYLAANPPPRDAGPVAPWPLPHPDVYEIQVWRGVARMYSDQPEAAREAFDAAAELDPGRPEAYYRRGILEALTGHPDVAQRYLKNALASSTRMVSAWEALASLELEANNIQPALEHLGKAIELDPHRASAHFLAAIAHAKVSQTEPAAAALQAAFRIDAAYLEDAKQVDVLRRLFTPGEMEALLIAGDGDEAGAGES